MSQAKRAAARVLCGAAIAMASVASYAAPELGVYRWDVPTGPGNIDAFSQWLGSPVTVAAAFEARNTWDDIDGAAWQLGPWSQWVRAKAGRNISLAVPMLPLSGGSLASCAAGQYDVYWRNLANELTYNNLHWAYLRLGWEMDGGWFTWNATPGSGKEASYAGCFRRIVQVMRQAQPANQWKFVLNTAGGWRSKAYLDAIWPGDAYVDVVALDLYDQSWAANTYPYPAACDANCRLTRQQNAWNDYSWHLYTIRDYALAHGKKVALPEWGIAVRPDGHGGADNPFFIRKMHEFISNPANNVAYHAYWNVSAGDIDGRLTDSVRGDSPSGATRFPQAASVFKTLFGPTAPTTPPPATGPTGVTFTAPAANATLAGLISQSSACEVTGTSISQVVFFMDGTQLNTEGAAPWQCTVDTRQFANGTHTLRAVAYNAAGASTTVTRTVNIQNGTASPAPQRTNVALASAGAAASASTTASAAHPVSSIVDNERTGRLWGNNGGWGDSTQNAYPDWVQINFSGAKSIDRLVVYTLPDNYYANPGEPTDTTTFSLYGIVDFTVQGWNGASWVNLASVQGNNLVKRTVSFPAFTTDRVRVQVTKANGWSRIIEVEAWGIPAASALPAANVALASAGAAASASTTASAAHPVSSIIDNERTGRLWGNNGGWGDSTQNAYPDWVQVNFSGAKSIDRLVVYTLPDNYYANPGEPTDTTTFSLYGIVDFTVQGWNGASWVNLASVQGNNLVKRTVSFPAFMTDRVRVQVTKANGWSRIIEVEAWGR